MAIDDDSFAEAAEAFLRKRGAPEFADLKALMAATGCDVQTVVVASGHPVLPTKTTPQCHDKL